MRILQVNSSSTWGGGETHVQQLTEFLRERGHDVVIAGRPNSRLDPDIKLPFLNSADFITAKRLRHEVQKVGFDILHAHLARDYTIVAAAAWAMSSQSKVVFTRHLLHPIRPHFFYRRVDAWIAPTAQILNTLPPLAQKTATVIPNWVDLGNFVFRPHALRTPVTIGLLGQLSPHKGHDDAIEAARQLGSSFRLVIAGEGKPAYEDALKKKATGLSVEFPGFASVPQFFREIDMLIVPSWEEPFGIVLLEAMAVGIPVIATARGGPPEIISSPAEGVLVPPRDPSALANAIKSLASDDQRRLSIVGNARARVEANFDMRAVVPKIVDVYQRVLGNSHKKAISGTDTEF
jgi:glycosyltransferase involved in cell wall biosynthesis